MTWLGYTILKSGRCCLRLIRNYRAFGSLSRSKSRYY